MSCLATLCKEVSLLQTFLPRWRLFQDPVLWWILFATGVQSITVSDAEKTTCTPQRCLFRGRLSYMRHTWSDSEHGHEKGRSPWVCPDLEEKHELMEYWVVHGSSQQVAPWLQKRSALPVGNTALCLHPGKEDKCFPSAVG